MRTGIIYKSMLTFWAICLYTTHAFSQQTVKDSLDSDYKNRMAQGDLLFKKGEVLKSIASYNEALVIAQKTGKPALVSEAMVYIGQANMESGQFEEALKHYFKALDIVQQSKDSTQYYYINVSVGMVYAYLRNYDKGLNYLKESYRFFKNKQLYRKMSFALGNMAAIEKERGHLNDAILYLEENLKYAQQEKIEEYIIFSYNGLGECYFQMGEKDKSLAYFQQGLELSKKIKHEWYMQNILINIGTILNDKKKYAEAENYLNEALQIVKKSKKLDVERTVYQTLMTTAIGKGDPAKAQFYANKALTLGDSIFTKNMSAQIADTEVKYETEKKEKALLEQKAENFRQRTWLFALIISLLALTTFGYLYYNRYRLKQKTILDAAIIREQQQGLNAVIEAQETERKRISKDLHDGIAQELVALKLGFNRLQNKIEKVLPDESKNIETLTNQLNESCNEVRNIAHVMMPPNLETSGLVSALEMLLRNSLSHVNIQSEFEHYDLPEHLNDKTEIGLYRIAQELLNNILKHAQASKVMLQLYKAGNQLIMRFEDNGKGFDFESAKNKSSMGLLNILSRVNNLGGTFFSEKGVAVGTISTVRIPLQQV